VVFLRFFFQHSISECRWRCPKDADCKRAEYQHKDRECSTSTPVLNRSQANKPSPSRSPSQPSGPYQNRTVPKSSQQTSASGSSHRSPPVRVHVCNAAALARSCMRNFVSFMTRHACHLHIRPNSRRVVRLPPGVSANNSRYGHACLGNVRKESNIGRRWPQHSRGGLCDLIFFPAALQTALWRLWRDGARLRRLRRHGLRLRKVVRAKERA